MKRPSVLAIVFVMLVFVLFRFQYGYEQKKVTTWDAFGYYMYLPSVFIYHDVKKLDWVDNIDKQYQLTGGQFYQATKLETGTFTNKYLGGVAILQMPFFFVGHWTAAALRYPQDGFSEPYQLAIIWGCFILGIHWICFFKEIIITFF